MMIVYTKYGYNFHSVYIIYMIGSRKKKEVFSLLILHTVMFTFDEELTWAPDVD